MQAQIDGTASLEGALRLVDALARHPHVLVEERLSFNRVRIQRQDQIRIDGLLSAYFILGNPARNATAAGSRPRTPRDRANV